MKRFIQDENRTQLALLPESLDDYAAGHNSVGPSRLVIFLRYIVNMACAVNALPTSIF